MKNLKMVLGAFALMLAVSAALITSGFTSKPAKVNARAYQTYHMTLSAPTVAQENNSNNWALGAGSAECGGAAYLCTISAPQGAGGKPDFSGISGNVRSSEQIEAGEFKD